MSWPLQPGVGLLRCLRPTSRTLAFLRPTAVGHTVLEFPSSAIRDVLATRSCLLYAERIRDSPCWEERLRTAPAFPFWARCVSHFHLSTITTLAQVSLRQHRSQG